MQYKQAKKGAVINNKMLINLLENLIFAYFTTLRIEKVRIHL